MTALVAKQLIPVDLSLYPNIGWYREEGKPFAKVLVISEGIDRLSPDLDGVRFEMALTAPNQPTGKTVSVEVIFAGSTINTFRVEYVPYTVSASTVGTMVSNFCDPESVKRDNHKLDMFWVRTRTPLDKVPHWIVATNLIKNETIPRRVVCTVKDRDTECFFCRETTHWSNKCHIKKDREYEERVKMNNEKRQARQDREIAAARARAHREQEEIRRLNQARLDRAPRPSYADKAAKQHDFQGDQDANPEGQDAQRRVHDTRHQRQDSRLQSQDDHLEDREYRLRSQGHTQNDQSPYSPELGRPTDTPHSGKATPKSAESTPQDEEWLAVRNGARPVRYQDLSPGGSEAALIDSLSPQYSPFSSLGDEDPDACWHKDFLDATSPKLLSRVSPTTWEQLHRTGEGKSIQDTLVQERKKRGLERMKHNNEAQKAKATFERERKLRKQREETQILDAAIKTAQKERSQLRTEERRKKQKQEKEKQREKDQEEDQALIDEVTQSSHATMRTRRSTSKGPSPSVPSLSPPPFITPQPSRPMTRACRSRMSQNQLLRSHRKHTQEIAKEKAAQPATPKASRSTSSTPRKVTKTEGDTSLDCFFSSDPNSELSQIETFMEQSGRHTPASSSKRLFDLSDHASGSKKIRMATLDDSYEWSDMVFTQGDFQVSASSHDPAHAQAATINVPALSTAPDPAPAPAPAPAHIDNSAQEVITTEDQQRP